MPRAQASSVAPRLITLAAFAGVVAALYFAREILIPLALATLLSFVLSPVVSWLERWGLRRVLAVAVVMILAATPIVVVGWVVSQQFSEQATHLPEYRTRIEGKLDALRAGQGSAVGRAMRLFREVGRTGAGADQDGTDQDGVQGGPGA